jgi:alpha-beta hydrolase superfamily lysophospholipase
MVLSRTNPQVADAIELTRHALQHAKDRVGDYGQIPEVTVTGHSLGGALAQSVPIISA